MVFFLSFYMSSFGAKANSSMTNPEDDGLWGFLCWSNISPACSCRRRHWVFACASAKNPQGVHLPIPSFNDRTSMVKLRPWAEPLPSPHSSSYTEKNKQNPFGFESGVSRCCFSHPTSRACPSKGLTAPSGLFDGWK